MLGTSSANDRSDVGRALLPVTSLSSTGTLTRHFTQDDGQECPSYEFVERRLSSDVSERSTKNQFGQAQRCEITTASALSIATERTPFGLPTELADGLELESTPVRNRKPTPQSDRSHSLVPPLQYCSYRIRRHGPGFYLRTFWPQACCKRLAGQASYSIWACDATNSPETRVKLPVIASQNRDGTVVSRAFIRVSFDPCAKGV